MNNKTMLQRSLLTTGITLALGLSFGLSQNALADTANDDLEVRAGLTQAMTLNCAPNEANGPLDFGITRLDLDTYVASTLTVIPNATGGNGTTSSTGDTGVTYGSTDHGSCTLSGSNATGQVVVSFSDADGNFDGTELALVGSGSPYSLDAPTTDLTVTDGFYVDAFSEDHSDLSAGGTTIYIGGTLNIPTGIVADNLGGYTAEIKVEVDDEFTG